MQKPKLYHCRKCGGILTTKEEKDEHNRKEHFHHYDHDQKDRIERIEAMVRAVKIELEELRALCQSNSTAVIDLLILSKRRDRRRRSKEVNKVKAEIINYPKITKKEIKAFDKLNAEIKK